MALGETAGARAMEDMAPHTADDHAEKLSNPGRLDALRQAEVLDKPQTPAFDRAVRLASRLLGVPVSLVSFVDDQRQFFAAQTGLTGQVCRDRGTPLSHSFCQYVVSSEAPLVVSDARLDPRLARNGAVHDLDVIAYLGVPIRSPQGHVLGSFCAIESQPRVWKDTDIAALEDIAAGLETELTLRSSIDERDVILQEMNHRVKNLFTLVGSMIRMERAVHDTASELADSMSARLRSLASAHALITPSVTRPATGTEAIALSDLCQQLLSPFVSSMGSRFWSKGPEVRIGPRARVYLALALHELATNSVKHGALSGETGSLSVSWSMPDTDTLAFDWAEAGLPDRGSETTPGGFGARLLSIAVEHQLLGRIDKSGGPARYDVRLSLPISTLAV